MSSNVNDAAGRRALFSRDAQGSLTVEGERVRRVVMPELFAVFKQLEASGKLEKLHKAGLVRTWAPENEGPNVLAHEYVPFVTYPQEWTLEMLRDAAVCTLDLAIELADVGLRIHDAHPWNVTFLNDKPVFLDFSSIKPGGVHSIGWLSTFFSSFYLPLWLRNKRLFTLSRMVANEEHPLGARDGAKATGRYMFRRRRLGMFCFSYWLRAWRLKDSKNPRSALIALRNHVAGMTLPVPRTKWAKYYTPGGEYGDLANYTDKAKAVDTLLAKISAERGTPPGSKLLDMACNHGWFAGLAATHGHRVMGVDLDDNAVNIARAERAGKYNLTVGRMNLLWPTPPQGLFLQLAGALDRWQCDTALMVALTHHLVIKQEISFDALAGIPAAFGVSNVIVEWIPRDDVFLRRWERGDVYIPPWYTEENFVAAFAKRWPQYEKVQSGVRDSDGIGIRRMYLFRK